MNFDMTTPCNNCPFRSDLPDGYLTAGRVREIADSLYRGESFPCHKTTVEDDEDDDGCCGMRATEDSQACAGAELFLMKQGMSTQLGRIAERLGVAARLDEDAPVCGSLKEMLAVHRRRQNRKVKA